MAVRTKEEIIKMLSDYFGDDNSDKVISIIEDVSDTIYSYDGEEREDWRRKYETEREDWDRRYRELDDGWRKRYRDRFMRKGEYEDEYKSEETDRFKEIDGEDVEYKEKKRTFEDLFEEEKEEK